MDTPKTIQETGLDEQTILYRLSQYETFSSRRTANEQMLQAQKESQILSFKQDSRRTALQLSERMSRDGSGEKESDPIKVIANAEILYVWLTEESKDAIDLFMKTGVLRYSSK